MISQLVGDKGKGVVGVRTILANHKREITDFAVTFQVRERKGGERGREMGWRKGKRGGRERGGGRDEGGVYVNFIFIFYFV